MNDGLHVINEVEPESLDVMIVDAGSNDASLAISCPPAPFLAQEFLEKALQVLRPQGLLVVNCVTRSDSAFQDALKSMQVSSFIAFKIAARTNTAQSKSLLGHSID